MIVLYPELELRNSVINTPSFARRNNEDDKNEHVAMSPQQIKIEAGRILSGGLSPRVWRILDLLSTGGVLPVSRLPALNERKMRQWAQIRLFERLSVETEELHIQMEGIQLLDDKPLYLLGPVGVEIASIRHGVVPPSGYQAYTPMRIMHDIATNEIVLRLAAMIGGRGWTVDWLGKYEATLTDKSGKAILEPDAVIRFRKDGEDGGDGAFALEYHNEDWQTRAAFKVERYERAFSDGNWREQWEVETFPPVLVSFLKPIVGAGYQNATKGKKLNCTYFGKTFKSVLEGTLLDEWTNIGAGMKREIILPGGQSK